MIRNDKATVEELADMEPERLVVSPGPSHPRNAGISIDAIKHFAGKIPVLGVCLGHQAIGEAFGGIVDHAGELKHGKTSMIEHDGKGVFKNLPNPFEAVRYHSLAVQPERRTSRLRSNRPLRRKRRNNGHATPRDAHRRCPIPPRIDTDAAGEGPVAEFS